MEFHLQKNVYLVLNVVFEVTCTVLEDRGAENSNSFEVQLVGEHLFKLDSKGYR